MTPTPPTDRTRPSENPIRELVSIAAPTVAAMTSYTLMQFVDKWMVSRISPDPIYVGAQGNGGLAAFVPIAVVMGFLTIVNTYVSQNLGAGKPERGAAYAWNGLWIALGGAVLLVPYGFALPSLFEALGHSAERVALEAGYGRILVFGAFLTMASRGVAQYFYGIHKPSVILVASLAGNLVNLVLNYGLIYGNLGMPKWGIEGAAVATVVGTGVEFLIPMWSFLFPMHRKFGTRSGWKPSWSHISDIARLGWPGAVMFGNEMVCWAIFMVKLVGGFGEKHSTAGWIAHQYMSLSFMPTVGISIAITATVGKCMGMGRPDLAAQRAKLGVALACIYMSVCAIVFVVFREPLVRLFIREGTPPEDAELLVRLGSGFLIATAAFQFFDGLAMSLSGALRGAGDTRWVGVATILLSWGVIVGGGHFVVWKFPQWGSTGPWMAAAAYIILLSLVILARFWGGKWKTLRLIDRPEAAAHRS